jgi:hypothetical protein
MAFNAGVFGITRCRRSGAEDRRPQQDASEQLAEDRRLTYTIHALADQASEQQQQDEFRDELGGGQVGFHEKSPTPRPANSRGQLGLGRVTNERGY